MESMLSLEEQIEELLRFYSNLKSTRIKKGVYKIWGELVFKVISPEIVRGKFQIEIIVTKRFPKEIPIVKEINGEVPINFHKNDAKTLCLGIETEMKIFLQNTPNLLKFVNSFVIPYFYSFKIWRDTGKIPFGERTHSIEGIVEFYKEYLFLNNIYSILNVLKYVYFKKNLKGYYRCPCGSGKNINECYHQNQIRELSQINIKDDYICVYLYYEKKFKNKRGKFLYPLTNNKLENLFNLKNK